MQNADHPSNRASKQISVLLALLGCCFPPFALADPAVLSAIRIGALAGDLRPVTQLVTALYGSQPYDSLDELSQVLLQQYHARFLTRIAAAGQPATDGQR